MSAFHLIYHIVYIYQQTRKRELHRRVNTASRNDVVTLLCCVYASPNKSKSNQTRREEECLHKDAPRTGKHKRAIVLRKKGRKRKAGGEKAFLRLRCTTGGLRAVFTRRLCEFEITRKTNIISSTVACYVCWSCVNFACPRFTHPFRAPCVRATPPPSLPP